MTTGIEALTPKQQAFVEAYLECGNAAEAYRRTYACERMAAATIQREATRLLANEKVNHVITTLRAQAADEAALSRSWVLERLMEVVEVSMGHRTVPLRVQRTNKDTGKVEVSEVAVSAYDAKAANTALIALGRTDEVRLILDRVEHTGRGGAPLVAPEANSRELARAVLDMLREAHLTDQPSVAEEEPEEPTDEPPEGATTPSVETVTLSAAPPPEPFRPTNLTPGEREAFDNGARVAFAPEFGKWAVYCAAGRLHGYRRSQDDARALASSLKPIPEEEKA